MSGTRAKKNITLDTVLHEIRSLRREVSLFLPTESLQEFSNAKEIRAAYQKAQK